MSDEQLRAVLSEIEARAASSQRELNMVRAQQASKSRTAKILDLTIDELGTLEGKMYRGIGKAFLSTAKTEITDSLKSERDTIASEIIALEKKHEYLQTTYRNTQLHINAAMNRT